MGADPRDTIRTVNSGLARRQTLLPSKLAEITYSITYGSSCFSVTPDTPAPSNPSVPTLREYNFDYCTLSRYRSPKAAVRALSTGAQLSSKPLLVQKKKRGWRERTCTRMCVRIFMGEEGCMKWRMEITFGTDRQHYCPREPGIPRHFVGTHRRAFRYVDVSSGLSNFRFPFTVQARQVSVAGDSTVLREADGLRGRASTVAVRTVSVSSVVCSLPVLGEIVWPRRYTACS